MTDTIKCLVADILASAGPEGPRLVERLEKFCGNTESEIASLRNALKKANALIRAKDAKIRELKGQNAKLNKMMFGASADQNPEKGKATMNANANDNSGSENTPSEPSQNNRNSHHEEPASRKASAPRNQDGRGKQEFPKHLERCVIDMDTPDKKCPCGCGGSIRGYDVNETLEVIPARHYVAVRRYPPSPRTSIPALVVLFLMPG